jgi:hypothetical protein
MPKITIDCEDFSAALESLVQVSEEERSKALKALQRLSCSNPSADDVKVYLALQKCGLNRVHPDQYKKWRVEYDKMCTVKEFWLVPRSNFLPNTEGKTLSKVTLAEIMAEDALVDVSSLPMPPAGYDMKDWVIVDQVMKRTKLGRGVESTKIESGMKTSSSGSGRAASPALTLTGAESLVPAIADATASQQPSKTETAPSPVPAKTLQEHPSDEALQLIEQIDPNEVAKRYIKKTVYAFTAGAVYSEDPNEPETAEFNFRKYVASALDTYGRAYKTAPLVDGVPNTQRFLSSLPVMLQHYPTYVCNALLKCTAVGALSQFGVLLSRLEKELPECVPPVGRMLILLASREASDESEISFENERFEDSDNVFSSALYKAFTEQQRTKLVHSLQVSTAASKEIYKRAGKLIEVVSSIEQKEILSFLRALHGPMSEGCKTKFLMDLAELDRLQKSAPLNDPRLLLRYMVTLPRWKEVPTKDFISAVRLVLTAPPDAILKVRDVKLRELLSLASEALGLSEECKVMKAITEGVFMESAAVKLGAPAYSESVQGVPSVSQLKELKDSLKPLFKVLGADAVKTAAAAKMKGSVTVACSNLLEAQKSLSAEEQQRKEAEKKEREEADRSKKELEKAAEEKSAQDLKKTPLEEPQKDAEIPAEGASQTERNSAEQAAVGRLKCGTYVITTSRKKDLHGLKGEIVKDHLAAHYVIVVDPNNPCGAGVPDSTKQSGEIKFPLDKVAPWTSPEKALVPAAGTLKRPAEGSAATQDASKRRCSAEEEVAEAAALFGE